MKGDLVSSKHARVSILSLALILGACTTGGGATSAPPVAVATLAATSVPVGSATAAPPEPSGGPQPTPGAIDPCTLLTAGEASTLMGKTLSAGVSQALDPARACTFKSGTTEVKVILAPPAPDVATATSYWDAERAQVPAGVTVTDLTVFDRSAYSNGTPAGVPVSALFVIKGTYFFDLYCGFPACTQDASVTAAQLIVGRLP